MSNTDRLDKLIRDFAVMTLTRAGTINNSEESARELLAKYECLPPDKRLPLPMRLTCPECNTLHIDEGEFATKPHHTHSCQQCGLTWRPAVAPTVGVRFLPGFKNATPQPAKESDNE